MRPACAAIVTVTVNDPFAVFPCASLAEHVTAVVPIGKVLPDAGVQATGLAPSTRSDADTTKLTIAPDGVVAVADRLPGSDNTGAVVSTARPDSAIDRVPPFVLDTRSVALLAPRVVGWNVTVVVVSPAGATVVDAGAATLNCAASAPLMVKGGASVTSVGFPLAMTTDLEAVAPVSTAPKSIVVGETEIPGRPVPLKPTTSEPAFELVIGSVALFAPSESGWKVTLIVAVSPGPSVVVDGAPAANDDASVPVTASGVLNVMLVSRRFLIVSVCDRVSGGMTPPKSIVSGALTMTMF
jgi:hypothetical protein